MRTEPPLTAASTGNRMPKEKEASRKRYRAFIKEKGLFGDKDGPEDEKKDAPPADKGKPDAAASDDKPQDKPKKPIKTTLLRYFAELKMRRSRIVFILVMILVNTLLQAVMPWSGKFIIDNILSLRDLSVLVAFCAVLLCIGVSNVALNFMQDYIINTFLTKNNICSRFGNCKRSRDKGVGSGYYFIAFSNVECLNG